MLLSFHKQNFLSFVDYTPHPLAFKVHSKQTITADGTEDIIKETV